MRARIPADTDVACRCSGAECKFARIIGEALRDEFDLAFDQARKEIIAEFGTYDMPLASRSSGTLRGRMLANGDSEIEIGLPDDGAGGATVAAHEAAGVVVRPHIDAGAAESIVEGDTRVYRKALSGPFSFRRRMRARDGRPLS